MPAIEISTEGAIHRIELARPDRRNALSLEMMSELLEALAVVPPEAQAVVLSAQGPVFSAGHDMSEMIGRDPGFYDRLFGVCTDMMLAIQHLPQPVIARVHGPATAAGCQLVASCDLAVAVDTAWFATPGVKIGLFCTTPMVPVLRAVGRKRAMEMLLTGRPIDAATAVAWGLINRAVPAEQLDAAIDELIDAITASSATVIGLGKDAFYRQVDLDLTQAYRVAAPIMAANAALADAQEGMSAFLEKRRPVWPEDTTRGSGQRG
jgi:enoyl-CoA hydratase/carnithine racemase